MKINMKRGLLRLWVFISAIWLVSFWMISGDIIKNRYPTGAEFIVILDIAEPVPDQPLEIITESLEFKDLTTDLNWWLASDPEYEGYFTKVEFPNRITLYIKCHIITSFLINLRKSLIVKTKSACIFISLL